MQEAAGMHTSNGKYQPELIIANSQNGSGSSSSEPSSNAPATPTSSAAGALNGTALTTFHVDANNEPVTHIFYQDYKAQIRRLQKIDSIWSGGSNFPAVVDFNAKPGTPLACINYTDPGTNITTVRMRAVQIAQDY